MSETEPEQKKKGKFTGNRHDWVALKSEWLQTNLSLNKFREQKGITSALFYKTIDTDKWYADRARIDSKAMQKLEDKLVSVKVKKWSEYSKLWGAVKSQAASILNKTRNPDGTITPLDTVALRNLTASIETALKCERLIEGESTENVSKTIDVYGHILGLSEEVNDPRNSQKELTGQTLEAQQLIQDQV